MAVRRAATKPPRRVTVAPARASVTIDRALANPKLLGAALGDLSSWSTWIAVLCAAYGQPLDRAMQTAFRRVSGGRRAPTRKVRELIISVSRRGGKGRMAAA